MDDTPPPANAAAVYRILMTDADVEALGGRGVESDVLLPATFIADGEVHYLVGLRYRGETSSESVTGAVALLNGEYHRFGKFGTVASFELAYIPVLTGESRYRIEATASLSQELVRDFNIAVSPYYSFDSRPPRPTLNDEDWGWISSVGWTF